MKFGIIHDFRNPPQWRRPYPELYHALLDQIVRAEEFGYDNVWLAEHHFTEDGYNPSSLPTAAAIAARTSRIRIGTYILLMPFQQPVRVAEDTTCIDIWSNGRLIWVPDRAMPRASFRLCISHAKNVLLAWQKASNWSAVYGLKNM